MILDLDSNLSTTSNVVDNTQTTTDVIQTTSTLSSSNIAKTSPVVDDNIATTTVENNIASTTTDVVTNTVNTQAANNLSVEIIANTEDSPVIFKKKNYEITDLDYLNLSETQVAFRTSDDSYKGRRFGATYANEISDKYLEKMLSNVNELVKIYNVNNENTGDDIIRFNVDEVVLDNDNSPTRLGNNYAMFIINNPYENYKIGLKGTFNKASDDETSTTTSTVTTSNEE